MKGVFRILTKREKEVMDYLWDKYQQDENFSFTCNSILEDANTTWSKPNLTNILTILEDKGMIGQCGGVRSVKTYSREFRVTITRVDYNVKVALLDLKRNDVTHFIGAFMKEAGYEMDEGDLSELKEKMMKIKNIGEK